MGTLSSGSKKIYRPNPDKKSASVDIVGMGSDISNTIIADNYATLISNFKPGKGSEWTKREGTLLIKAPTLDGAPLAEERDSTGNIIASNGVISPDFSNAFADGDMMRFFAVKGGFLLECLEDGTTEALPWYSVSENFNTKLINEDSKIYPTEFKRQDPITGLAEYVKIDSEISNLPNPNKVSTRTQFGNYQIWTIGSRILIYPINGQWAGNISEDSEVFTPHVDEATGIPKWTEGVKNKFWLELPAEQLDNWKYAQLGDAYNVNFLSTNPGYRTESFETSTKKSIILNSTTDGILSNTIADGVTKALQDVEFGVMENFLLYEELQVVIYYKSAVSGERVDLLNTSAKNTTTDNKNSTSTFNFAQDVSTLIDNVKEWEKETGKDASSYLDEIFVEVNLYGNLAPDVSKEASIEITRASIAEETNIKVDVKYNDKNVVQPLVELAPNTSGILAFEKWDENTSSFIEISRQYLDSSNLETNNEILDILIPEWNEATEGIYQVVVYYATTLTVNELTTDFRLTTKKVNEDTVETWRTGVADGELFYMIGQKYAAVVSESGTKFYDKDTGDFVLSTDDYLVDYGILDDENNTIMAVFLNSSREWYSFYNLSDLINATGTPLKHESTGLNIKWAIRDRYIDVIENVLENEEYGRLNITAESVITDHSIYFDIPTYLNINAVVPVNDPYKLLVVVNTSNDNTGLIYEVTINKNSPTDLISLPTEAKQTTGDFSEVVPSILIMETEYYVESYEEYSVLSSNENGKVVTVILDEKTGHITTYTSTGFEEGLFVSDLTNIHNVSLQGNNLQITQELADNFVVIESDGITSEKNYNTISFNVLGEDIVSFNSEKAQIAVDKLNTGTYLWELIDGEVKRYKLEDGGTKAITNVTEESDELKLETKKVYYADRNIDGYNIYNIIETEQFKYIKAPDGNFIAEVIETDDSVEINKVNIDTIPQEFTSIRFVSDITHEVEEVTLADITIDKTVFESKLLNTEVDQEYIIDWTETGKNITSDWWRHEDKSTDWTVYAYVKPEGRNWYRERSNKWYIENSGQQADLEQTAVFKLNADIWYNDAYGNTRQPSQWERYVRIPRGSGGVEQKEQKNMLLVNNQESTIDLLTLISNASGLDQANVKLISADLEIKWSDITLSRNDFRHTMATSTKTIPDRILKANAAKADNSTVVVPAGTSLIPLTSLSGADRTISLWSNSYREDFDVDGSNTVLEMWDRTNSTVTADTTGTVTLTDLNTSNPKIKLKMKAEQFIAGEVDGWSYANWFSVFNGIGRIESITLKNIKISTTKELRALSFVGKQEDNSVISMKSIECDGVKEFGTNILGYSNEIIDLVVDQTITPDLAIIEAYKKLPFAWIAVNGNVVGSPILPRLGEFDKTLELSSPIGFWDPATLVSKSRYRENELVGNSYGIIGNKLYSTYIDLIAGTAESYEYKLTERDIFTEASVGDLSKVRLIDITKATADSNLFITAIYDDKDVLTSAWKLTTTSSAVIQNSERLFEYKQEVGFVNEDPIAIPYPEYQIIKNGADWKIIGPNKIIDGTLKEVIVNTITGSSIVTFIYVDGPIIPIAESRDDISIIDEGLFTIFKSNGRIYKSINKEEINFDNSEKKIKEETVTKDSAPAKALTPAKVKQIIAQTRKFVLCSNIDSSIVENAFKNIIKLATYKEQTLAGSETYRATYDYDYQFRQLEFQYLLKTLTKGYGVTSTGIQIDGELFFNYNLKFELSTASKLQDSLSITDSANNNIFQNSIISQLSLTQGTYSANTESLENPTARIIPSIVAPSIKDISNIDGTPEWFVEREPEYDTEGNITGYTDQYVVTGERKKIKALHMLAVVSLDDINTENTVALLEKSLDLTRLAENDYYRVIEAENVEVAVDENGNYNETDIGRIFVNKDWKPFIDYSKFVPPTTGRVMILSIVIPEDAAIWMDENDFPLKIDDAGNPSSTGERVMSDEWLAGVSKWIKPESFGQLANYTQTKIVEIASDEKDVDKLLSMRDKYIWEDAKEFSGRLLLASKDKIYISEKSNPFHFPSFVATIPSNLGVILGIQAFQGSLIVIFEKGFAAYSPESTSDGNLFFGDPLMTREMPTILNKNCIAANSTAIDVLTVEGVYRIYQYQLSTTNVPAFNAKLLSAHVNSRLKNDLANASDMRLFESLYKTIVKVTVAEKDEEGNGIISNRLYIYDERKEYEVSKSQQKWYTYESDVFDIDQMIVVPQNGVGVVYFTRLGAAELLRFGYTRLLNNTEVPGFLDRAIPKSIGELSLIDDEGNLTFDPEEVITSSGIPIISRPYWGIPIKSVLLTNGLSSENDYDMKIKIISNQINHHGYAQSYYRKYYLLDKNSGQFVDTSSKDDKYEVVLVTTETDTGTTSEWKVAYDATKRYEKVDLSSVNRLDVGSATDSSVRMKEVEVYASDDFVIEDRKRVGTAKTSQLKTTLIHSEDLPFTFKKIRFVIKEKKHK